MGYSTDQPAGAQGPAGNDGAPGADASAPAGGILAYGGTAAPTGYLLCNGASVLRADYPDLFTAIGTTYGSVDGTHFNVPDLRMRIPIGDNSVVALGANDGLAENLRNFDHDHGAGTLATADHNSTNNSPTTGGSTRLTSVGHNITGRSGASSVLSTVPHLIVNYIIKT